MSVLVATVAVAAISSCGSPAKSKTRGDGPSGQPPVQVGERECVTVYKGGVRVNASDFVHMVERAGSYAYEPIEGLDRAFTKSTIVRFTLDYPFERPYQGVVTGDVTLRRTIDAVRAGFREAYEGTEQRDIPGMENKDVNGSYGRAFHVIDDLVIESIELCGDGTLSIFIGS